MCLKPENVIIADCCMQCFAVGVFLPYNVNTKASFWLVNFCSNNFEDELIVFGMGRLSSVWLPCMICDVQASTPMFFCDESGFFRNRGKNG